MRTGVLAVGGWAAAASLAVGVSGWAITVVRDSVVPRTDVSSALPAPAETATPTRSARPSPTTPVPPAAGASGLGGSVTVRCVRGVPTFISTVPKQGYQPERDDSSPEVKFTSGTHRTEITATCTGPTPRLSVEEKSLATGGGDDNGGDNGGRGRGRGGSGDG